MLDKTGGKWRWSLAAKSLKFSGTRILRGLIKCFYQRLPWASGSVLRTETKADILWSHWNWTIRHWSSIQQFREPENSWLFAFKKSYSVYLHSSFPFETIFTKKRCWMFVLLSAHLDSLLQEHLLYLFNYLSIAIKKLEKSWRKERRQVLEMLLGEDKRRKKKHTNTPHFWI